MTVTQTDSGATVLTARSAGMANAVVAATIKSVAVAATPSTFFDSDVLENTSAETWREYEIESQLGNNYTIENLSTCQSLTGNVVAPVGSGGFGRVRVTDGVVSKILKTDTTVRSGHPFREFVEYSEGSISRYLYDQVSQLFDATPDVDYYSSQNHATSTYTRNAACWAASIDLSCVAVASGGGTDWTRQRGGVLITPRHILITRHFAYGIGTQVRFSNAAGTVETRTITGTSTASVALDLWVCTLSAAVTIANPCAIAGAWITQGRSISGGVASWFSGGVAIHTNQEGKIFAGTLGKKINLVEAGFGNISIGGETFSDCEGVGYMDHSDDGAIPSAYAAMCHTPVTGDSGQPCFIVIAGEPVLLWTWTTPSGGTPAYLHDGAVLDALIVVANDNAVVNGHTRPTDHTVTVAPDPTL